MPDPELQWIPDETARSVSVRTRATSVAVLAVSCVLIGIVMGRLTAGIPARTGSGPPDVVGAPSAKNPAEPGIEKPNVALKSDTETSGAQKRASSPSTEAERKTDPPPVVLLNPGTADKSPSAVPEEMRPRSQPVKEPRLRVPPQENRKSTDERRDMLSRSAPDYQSLREYMLGR